MRPTHLVTLLVLMALAVASAPTPARADAIVSICDEAHLLAALTSGGTVTFSCSGTITLTDTIEITADTTIDGSGQSITISGNHAVRAFSVNHPRTLTLNALAVVDGGIKVWGGTLAVSHCTFSGNRIAIDNGRTLTVNHSTFSGNHATNFYGGAIYNADSAIATVNNSTFSGNQADRDGGAICNYGGTLTVSNSTFAGNSANDFGGGIRNAGTLTVSNSTFSGNSATGGGGIFARNGAAQVINSTFSGNSATAFGGSIYNNDYEGAVTTLKNTIVTNSPAGGNCSGTISDGGGNLSYPDTTCPGINSDPKLGPLQNNGGPTQTMALGVGSAAIDTAVDAVCAAHPVNNRDQRGFTRPWGLHCDIGAFEALALPPRAYLPMIVR